MRLITLKRPAEFKRVRGGKRVAGPWFVIEAKARPAHAAGDTAAATAATARVGLTITKKLGGAVIRNRLRRRLKEEYPQRYQVLATSGVGGIRSPQGVKCLHTHAADYLARGENAIGAETLELLQKPWFCPDAECREYEK